MSVTDENKNAPVQSDSRNALALRRRGGVERCNSCGVLVGTDEPLCLTAHRSVVGWSRMVGWGYDENGKMWLLNYTDDKGGMCACCARLSQVHRPGLFFKDGEHYWQLPCDTCERLVIKPAGLVRRHAFCSPVCEERYYNRRRSERKAHTREKVCEACDEPFTATRRDAKTCSASCKQKAHRRRKKEATA